RYSSLRTLPSCPTRRSSDLGAFDLIAEFSAPGIGWYKQWLADLAGPLSRSVHRYEANFVFGRSVRRAIDEDAVWVRENGGFKRIDRKSTRLNSSHLGISYAV